MNSMKKVIFISTCILIFGSLTLLFAVDAKDIIRKSEDAVKGKTAISEVEIVIKTRKWTRSMVLQSWENRIKKKSFSEITAPQKDAGNRFLLIGKEMRQYIPGLKKDIKISPSMMLQSWMGSDFTNDDIVKESSITEDYTHKLDGIRTVDGHECYRIILVPVKGAAVVWGKIIYYARKSDYLPVRQEFYNEHDVLKKVLTCSEFRLMHDRVIPTVYKMQTTGREDRYTLMKIRKIRFDQKIPDSVFSLQNLKRK